MISDVVDLIFSVIFLFLEMLGIKRSPKKKAELGPLPPPSRPDDDEL